MGKLFTAVAAAAAIVALSGCGAVEDAAKDASKAANKAAKSGGGGGGCGDCTVAQENALGSAESYLELSGFSRAGLLQQLTSKAGEGYNPKDAQYAVNNVDVDWNQEAVESAKSYLEISSFSRDGLLEQLTSSAGEGFTQDQATFAVNKVGL